MVARNNNKVINISTGGENLKHVQELRYLGSIITEDGRSKKESVKRISLGSKDFHYKKSFFSTLYKGYLQLRKLLGPVIWMWNMDNLN